MPVEYDLRTMFHAIGGLRTINEPPDVDDLAERPDSFEDIDLYDEDARPIGATPADVAAWVDGIQASMRVCYREHRVVRLMFVAAGAVTTTLDPVMLEDDTGQLQPARHEQLQLLVSATDDPWVDQIRGNVPKFVLDETNPADLERESAATPGRLREQAETRLVTQLLGANLGLIAVDGALSRHHNGDRRLVGIIKSTGTRYLPDEQVLFDLPAGWRSPRFTLKGRGDTHDRTSCYLRLAASDNQRWNHALIRLETHDPDLLDPVAAACLKQVQFDPTADSRFDRQVQPIRGVEKWLRARQPAIFSV